MLKYRPSRLFHNGFEEAFILLTDALRDGLRKVYSATIDRTKFREIATRYVVFVLPLFYWGRAPWWWGAWIIVAGVLIRAWAAGHLRKDQSMAFGGPYLLVRHPLYLGSCLLSVGLIVILHHWFSTLLLGGLTVLAYVHQIRHEEENLRKRFGESYVRYSETAGPFWPKPKGILNLLKGAPDRTRFSPRQYLKNREYECLLGVLAVFVLLWITTR